MFDQSTAGYSRDVFLIHSVVCEFLLLMWSAECRVIAWLGFVELLGLTTEDHVTLTIIERYLDLKVSCLDFLLV